jgi:hypothetical protein
MLLYAAIGLGEGLKINKINRGANPKKPDNRSLPSRPAHFPWTMGVIASYETEGIIYGKYILQHMTDAKIGVSYQNDDLGKDYFKGLQEEVSTTFRPLYIA